MNVIHYAMSRINKKIKKNLILFTICITVNDTHPTKTYKNTQKNPRYEHQEKHKNAVEAYR